MQDDTEGGVVVDAPMLGTGAPFLPGVSKIIPGESHSSTASRAVSGRVGFLCCRGIPGINLTLRARNGLYSE